MTATTAGHELITVVLIVLATYRATVLITDDRIFAVPVLKIQEALEARLRPDRPVLQGHENEWQSPLAYLLSCPYCLSVWMGAAVVAVVDTLTPASVPMPGLTAVAASAATGLLASWSHDE